MNPYDDNPPSRRGRSSRPDWEDDYPGGRDDYPAGRDDRDYRDHGDYERESWREDPTTRSSGRSSVGRASVGRASVPVPPPAGNGGNGGYGGYGGNGDGDGWS